MEFFEEGEEWGNPFHHLIAGSVAGVAEHCGMFPIDTIKVFFNKNKRNMITPKSIAQSSGAAFLISCGRYTKFTTHFPSKNKKINNYRHTCKPRIEKMKEC